MSRARRRFDAPIRGLTQEEAIEYIGHGRSWATAERLEALYATGFPRPDPLTERYDRDAIDAWMDRRSNLIPLDGRAAAAPQSTPRRNTFREAAARGTGTALRHSN